MRTQTTMPGIGANVIDGKLPTAIRIWKSELASSGKIEKLREKRNGYIKPSTLRREVLEAAKHRQKFKETI